MIFGISSSWRFHQKSIIATKIQYFFGECEKQLFPKNVRLYKNLEKYDIRYQLFMAILSKMGLGGNMEKKKPRDQKIKEKVHK